jgi:hypothetical protein
MGIKRVIFLFRLSFVDDVLFIVEAAWMNV